MTNEEIISFIQQMKKDYPNMQVLNSDDYQVWKNTLSKLPKEIVECKYLDHKKNPNFKNTPPSIMLFANYKEEKKEEEKKILMKCPMCGKYLYYDAMVLHEARHKSIRYIKSRLERYFHRQIDKTEEIELLNMSSEEFDNKYNKFLEKLIPYVCESEQSNILRIKYSKDHPLERIPIDIQNEYKDFLRTLTKE